MFPQPLVALQYASPAVGNDTVLVIDEAGLGGALTPNFPNPRFGMALALAIPTESTQSAATMATLRTVSLGTQRVKLELLQQLRVEGRAGFAEAIDLHCLPFRHFPQRGGHIGMYCTVKL